MNERRKKDDENYAKWLYEKLFLAYLEARRGKRRSFDENAFEMNAVENVKLLAEEIMEKRYEPSRGIAFIIRDPVIREVFAAPFRDRVVHHLLYRLNGDWWDRRLIYDSYSCREGKGTLFGVQRLQHYMRSVSQGGKVGAHVIKMDIQGYFMSLPRKGLYERVLLSNIYLDQLDRFVTMTLGYKAYGRYVDDFYIVVDDERYPQALKDIRAIKEFLESINLTLHPRKRYIQPVRRGVQFIGARVYPTHILPGYRLEKNFRRAMKEVAEGRRTVESVASYMGHMKHFRHKKLENEVFGELGWEYRF